MAKYVNPSELESIYRGLKAGESLVISDTGVIYKTSRIRVDKLTEVIGKIPSRLNTSFDTGTLDKEIKTRSWVESPGKSFKNFWDNIRKNKKNYQDSIELPPIVEFWIDSLENLSSDDIQKIRVNIVQEVSFTFYEVILPNSPLVMGINKNGIARYYIFKGKKILL